MSLACFMIAHLRHIEFFFSLIHVIIMFNPQSKGDLQTAEEFYMRAILADPGDGEMMSQYAKLVWELHHDLDKALHYFERAVQATPGDRYNFMWYSCI